MIEHKVAKIDPTEGDQIKWLGKMFVWSGWINLAFIAIGLATRRIQTLSDVWAAQAFKVLSYFYIIGQVVAVAFLGTGLAYALALMAAIPLSEAWNDKVSPPTRRLKGSFLPRGGEPLVEWRHANP